MHNITQRTIQQIQKINIYNPCRNTLVGTLLSSLFATLNSIQNTFYFEGIFKILNEQLYEPDPKRIRIAISLYSLLTLFGIRKKIVYYILMENRDRFHLNKVL